MSGISSNTGVQRSETTLPDPANVKDEKNSTVEERRARKREQDRLCQRRKREKDRENLRRLEARLNGLQKADETKTVLDLILRHEQDQAKIDRQVERMRQLQSLLQAGLADLDKDAKDASTTTTRERNEIKFQSPESDEQNEHGSVRTQSISHSYVMPGADGNTSTAGHSVSLLDMMSTSASAYNVLPTFKDYSNASILGPSALPDPLLGYSHTGPAATAQPAKSDGRSTAPWIAAGNMVADACKRVQQLHSMTVASPESVDQHILMTVFFYGWDHAIAFIDANHALWACLRQVDEVVLTAWNPTARLSSLWSMWMTMKAQSQGTEASATMEPKFMRPRPSQMHIPHRADIDYFVWPGVRERIVFDQDRYYSSESFLKLFSSSACFIWPFDIADTFIEDKRTRLLQFSPELVRRLYNIRFWSIDVAFLNEYPEFVGDIPTYNSIPPRVDDAPACGNQYFFFQNDEEDDDTHMSTTTSNPSNDPNSNVTATSAPTSQEPMTTPAGVMIRHSQWNFKPDNNFMQGANVGHVHSNAPLFAHPPKDARNGGGHVILTGP
ncbi:hypothetical protein AAFC00_005322 [Neodothiora populina]|uniref:BZIP transcription factor n=1 Tax=Neodothiora populina TaxID=2781224 RepID=A0ABR3PKI6_9PEZI